METYTTLRGLADVWGMVALFLIFVGILFWVFRPGSSAGYEDDANIIFRNENEPKGGNDGR